MHTKTNTVTAGIVCQIALYLLPICILSTLSKGIHATDLLHNSQCTPFNWFLEQTTS